MMSAGKVGSMACHDRQSLDRPETGSRAPANARILYRQLELRPTLEQGSERALTFNTRKLVAQAKMDAGTEGDVPVRPPFEIELFRMLVRFRIEVRSGQHGHDLVTLLQPGAAKVHVLSHEARLGELHRGNEAQKFLDGEVGAAPIRCQPIA